MICDVSPPVQAGPGRDRESDKILLVSQQADSAVLLYTAERKGKPIKNVRRAEDSVHVKIQIRRETLVRTNT